MTEEFITKWLIKNLEEGEDTVIEAEFETQRLFKTNYNEVMKDPGKLSDTGYQHVSIRSFHFTDASETSKRIAKRYDEYVEGLYDAWKNA